MEEWILALPTLVMPEILATLIPPVEKSENPILVLETAIAIKETQIGELFEKFAGNSNATIRAHAERQIERLGAEIEADKAALEKAKLETRMVEFADPAGFIERIEAAKALLGSTDPQTLYDARARLAQELRQRLDVVLLNPDSSMVVRVNQGRRASLAAIEFTFTTDRLLEVRSMLRDGSTFAPVCWRLL